jgi:uncharacterized protein YjbI with pentapeptide repeats
MLDKVNLHGATLKGASLVGADLHGAMADEQTVWPEGFNPTAQDIKIIQNG